jgi:DNA gyrase subunit A
MDLEPGDELCWAERTSGTDAFVLLTAQGQALTCDEDEVRVSGRTSGGVRGIRLAPGDYVVAMQLVDPDGALVMVSGNGLGKKTAFAEFPRQGRGGLGVRAAVVNQRTGPLVAARSVGPETEEIVAISAGGVVIRVPVKGVRFSHRQSQGATLMRVQPGDSVVALASLAAGESAGSGDGSESGAPSVDSGQAVAAAMGAAAAPLGAADGAAAGSHGRGEPATDAAAAAADHDIGAEAAESLPGG